NHALRLARFANCRRKAEHARRFAAWAIDVEKDAVHLRVVRGVFDLRRDALVACHAGAAIEPSAAVYERALDGDKGNAVHGSRHSPITRLARSRAHEARGLGAEFALETDADAILQSGNDDLRLVRVNE